MQSVAAQPQQPSTSHTRKCRRLPMRYSSNHNSRKTRPMRSARCSTQHPAVRQALERRACPGRATPRCICSGPAPISARSQPPRCSRISLSFLKFRPPTCKVLLQAIAATNPARAAAIDAQLGRTQSLFNEFKNAQAAEQKIHAQRMQEYVRNEDARFEQHLANEISGDQARGPRKREAHLARELRR